eukprot:Gregarina_sp_Poly_1__9182@NODE_564_length_7515_cov_115_964823_g443_i0_p2_GENE_NODE_564_length_7515_cov_115_964823_g443_i0NODE_564_length_7515_cov_115_964823_g443_i0_p2_ORF_typecomplete_len510_score60_80Methyltr_RsmBF/PF01189_17/2_6e10Methyltr_RsmBF/PF01189_17/7_9e22GCD14/PF08704_10/0_0086_NODE_564_length_7515_cov_115_964823_g443_i08832412
MVSTEGDLYQLVAKALLSVAKGNGLKTAVYRLCANNPRLPTILALAQNILDDYELLRSLAVKTQLLAPKDLPAQRLGGRRHESISRQSLAVLAGLSDYCRRGKLSGGTQATKALFASKKKELDLAKTKIAFKQSVKRQDPRYIRVDLSRLSSDEAVEILKKALPKDAFVTKDCLLEDVICVEDKKLSSQLVKLPSVKDGSIVMMDRSTCFAAHALAVSPGDVILDICAAPGSKSLAYISYLRDRGILLSIERSTDRFQTMVSRIGTESILRHLELVNLKTLKRNPISLADIGSLSHLFSSHACLFLSPDIPNLKVLAICSDFFDVHSCHEGICECRSPKCLQRLISNLRADAETRNDSCRIKISVDPSCSGSGLSEHAADFQDHKEDVYRRLTSLCSFQLSILQASLSLRLNTETLIYSTCSLFFEENEKVVASALQNFGSSWQLAQAYPRGWEVLDALSSRFQDQETPEPDWSNLCLRTSPQLHKCRGFFLAKFVSKSQRLVHSSERS